MTQIVAPKITPPKKDSPSNLRPSPLGFAVVDAFVVGCVVGVLVDDITLELVAVEVLFPVEELVELLTLLEIDDPKVKK